MNQPKRWSFTAFQNVGIYIHFIYVFVLGIVTDLTNIQDPLFICEHSALDQLVTGLMEPCHCGQVKWVTSSRKQVKKKKRIKVVVIFI